MRSLLATILAALAFSSGDQANQPDRQFRVGYADLQFEADELTSAGLQTWRADQAGASLIRQNIYWDRVSPAEPADPSNPSDPAYEWAAIDATVRAADARDLEVFFTILSAPAWAEGEDRPPLELYRSGAWRPDPAAAAQFGAALARRYSGAYPDPEIDNSTLPRVRSFEVWNEPNRSNYLAPQWEDGKHVGPEIYRRLLNGFWRGIKSSQPQAEVITGGTAPYGAGPLRTSTTDRQRGESSPLGFYRSLLCIREGDRLRVSSSCPEPAERAHFDVLAHHPINTAGGPTESARDPDNVTSADLDQLLRLLRFAERRGLVKPAGPKGFWATEIWWETDPPDQRRGVSPERQAEWMVRALYEVWRAGGEAVSFLQVTDTPADEADAPFATYQTGVYTSEGDPKPAAEALAFPCLALRGPGGELMLWTVPPSSGPLVFEALMDGAWTKLERIEASRSEPRRIALEDPSSGPRAIRCRQGERISAPRELGRGVRQAR